MCPSENKVNEQNSCHIKRFTSFVEHVAIMMLLMKNTEHWQYFMVHIMYTTEGTDNEYMTLAVHIKYTLVGI